MSESITITLRRCIVTHSGQVDRLTVREPRGEELFRYGEPFSVAKGENGVLMSAENDETIKKYIDACVVDVDPIHLGQLCLADAIALKEAVLGFFTAARLSNSSKSVTPSSST